MVYEDCFGFSSDICEETLLSHEEAGLHCKYSGNFDPNEN